VGVYCREIEIAIMHDLGFARAALLAGGEDLGDNLISASLLAHSLTHILSTYICFRLIALAHRLEHRYPCQAGVCDTVRNSYYHTQQIPMSLSIWLGSTIMGRAACGPTMVQASDGVKPCYS